MTQCNSYNRMYLLVLNKYVQFKGQALAAPRTPAHSADNYSSASSSLTRLQVPVEPEQDPLNSLSTSEMVAVLGWHLLGQHLVKAQLSRK